TVQTFENQEYPFEQLVEKVVVARDVSRNPLFDVVFTLQNHDITKKTIPGLTLKPYQYESNIAKFDLMLIATAENEKGLHNTFEYSTKLFKEETVKRFINYFKNVVTRVIATPDLRLGDIEILTEPEKEQLLVEFNETETQYPKNRTIHQHIRRQAEKKPDGIAVKSQDKAITYKELNKRAARLAVALREKGLETGSIAAIMMERSLEMIVGILGILNAGGAYLPIDPTHPLDRIDYMLKDSNTKIVLVDDKSEIRISKTETKPNDQNSKDQNQTKSPIVFNFEQLNSENISEPNKQPAPSPQHPESDIPSVQHPASGIAYIIYTSGSTGKPKGVMVEHNNLTNFIYTFYRDYK
ncbi:MAG: AMP-binding protein, partial [bacterium]|nr:AMP-binding protein [bacterium]